MAPALPPANVGTLHAIYMHYGLSIVGICVCTNASCGPSYIGRCGCTDSLNRNFAIVFIYYLQLWVCTPTHLHSALWATHMWRIVGQVLHHASIYIVVTNSINLAVCAPMQYTVGTTQ